MDPVPLLVTRAAADVPALARSLPDRRVVSAPCLEFEHVPVDNDVLGRFSGAPLDLLITSPRAVEALRILSLDDCWRVLALAPHTSAALTAAGLRVDRAVQGGAAELARITGRSPVVFLGSDLAGEEIWRERPDAQQIVVYRTVCPSHLPPTAIEAMEETFDLFFASPSALQNFLRLAPGKLKEARRIYAAGRTTRGAVAAQGRETLELRPVDR